MSLRVAVVDDQDLVRAGFVALLRGEPGIEVVGEARQGDEAVRLARATTPDVMLMDVRMPGLDGVEATRRITGDPRCAGVRVVMLTTFGLDEYVFGALRAGASGFVLKDTPPVDLLRAIQVAADGDALLSPSVTRRLMDAFVTTPPRELRPHPDLTDREAEVLALVAQGLTNVEIAAVLHVGPATVKTYVSRLLTKLDVTTRVHLVIHAYETGLK